MSRQEITTTVVALAALSLASAACADDLDSGEQQQKLNRVLAVDRLLDISVTHAQRLGEGDGDESQRPGADRRFQPRRPG